MQIAGVKFLSGSKIYYFDPQGQNYKTGDLVLVKTILGVEVGQVMMMKEIDPGAFKKQLMPVIGFAKDEDLEKFREFEMQRDQALSLCEKAIQKYELPMNLLDVHFSLDGEKVTFVFSAETRVDFRELVKDLVRIFKKQIILRQVGPRDEARLFGGFARCGRSLCCSTFLDNLESVTMEMAKDQNLDSKGSSKISGICGKLMCCLAYESAQYKELARNLPDIGARVKTVDGNTGVIIDRNIIRQTLLLENEESGTRNEVALSDIVKLVK